MDKVLELNQLTKKYGSLTAVNNLSFSVERGNVYGLLGPNGSGKSTTLGMVLNVVNATDGSWKWFGEPHHTRSLKKSEPSSNGRTSTRISLQKKT